MYMFQNDFSGSIAFDVLIDAYPTRPNIPIDAGDDTSIVKWDTVRFNRGNGYVYLSTYVGWARDGEAL